MTERNALFILLIVGITFSICFIVAYLAELYAEITKRKENEQRD